MSYNASQFQGITDAVHRKVNHGIPTDQNELLSRDKSWIHQLKESSQGLVNVPNYVLRTVTEAYSLGQARSAAPASPTAVAEEPEASLSSNMSASQHEVPESSLSKKTSPSSPARSVLSWSQSPERPRSTLACVPEEPSAVKETPDPDPASSPAHRNSPVRARKRKTPDAMPMSSLNEEEDMEVQLPHRDHGSDPGGTPSSWARNRPALRLTQQARTEVANTPPCAQPDNEVIPETVVAGKAKETRDVTNQTRPRKRMKPISLDNLSPTRAREGDFTAGGARMPSLKNLQLEETQETATAISSSVVTATLTQTPAQAAATSVETAARETRVSVSRNAAASKDLEATAKGKKATRESPRARLQTQGASTWAAEASPTTPLMAFHRAYPDYLESQNGSRSHFVKACYCLHFLRLDRALRDYLYDEFVRMFSARYLEYVSRAGPKREPLSAIEWFNMQKGPPLYREQVISSENLDEILQFYSKDVASMRDLVTHRPDDEKTKKKKKKDKKKITTGVRAAPEVEGAQTRLPQKTAEAVAEDEEREEQEEQEEAEAEEEALVGGAAEDLDLPFPAEDFMPFPEKDSMPPPSSGKSNSSPAAVSSNGGLKRLHAAAAAAVEESSDTKTNTKTATRKILARSSPQRASPELGSALLLLAGAPAPPPPPPPPPSSIRSDAAPPVGSQYMQQLSAARRSSSTSAAAAQKRKEKVRAAMQRRMSTSARSSSSRVGSS